MSKINVLMDQAAQIAQVRQGGSSRHIPVACFEASKWIMHSKVSHSKTSLMFSKTNMICPGVTPSFQSSSSLQTVLLFGL